MVCVYLSPCKSGAARSSQSRATPARNGEPALPAPQARPLAHAERAPASGQRGNQGGVFPRFSMHFWLSGSALNRPPALFAVSQRPIAVLTRRESYLALLSAAPPVEMGAVGLYMTQLKTCAEYSRSRRRPVALSRWSSPRWSSTACHFAPARRCMHWLIAPLSTLILVLLSPISADSSRPVLHQSTTPAYLISVHAAFSVVALTSSRPMLLACSRLSELLPRRTLDGF